MTEPKRLHRYLQQGRLLQLATARGVQPWVCTVYYVADAENNLYWLSYPTRRHSQELAQNPKAAVTVVVKPDLPVIGVQAEGGVSIVKDQTTVKQVMGLYIVKYNEGQKFYDNFLKGINKHQMYCFTPQRFVIFDEFHTD